MKRRRVFLLLARESLRDALRSRIGLGVLLLGAVLLLGIGRCTGAPFEGLNINGRELPASVAGSVLGPFVFLTVAFVLVAAAALVASDALARPLDDGSATLWLARPVGRATYALARLAGALVLVAGVALPVLGFATGMLALRFGLSWQVGLVGYATFLVDAIVVAAVAMLLSLHLPRMLALFGVFLWLQYLVFSNGMHVLGAITQGGGRLLEGYGPPLGTALLFAVAPWAGLDPPAADRALAAGRLLVWCAGAIALLVLSFRRRELR